jgi:hypothetical protein
MALDIASLLGISAAISAAIGGSVSAGINYIMTMREFKKRSHASLIEQRLEVYSYLIYQIDKMKYTYDALSSKNGEQSVRERYAYTEDEWKHVVEAFDTTLQNKYYLVNRKILELWTWVTTMRGERESVYRMRELRVELNKEYEEIRQQHVKIVGEGVQAIPLDIEKQRTP